MICCSAQHSYWQPSHGNSCLNTAFYFTLHRKRIFLKKLQPEAIPLTVFNTAVFALLLVAALATGHEDAAPQFSPAAQFQQ